MVPFATHESSGFTAVGVFRSLSTLWVHATGSQHALVTECGELG